MNHQVTDEDTFLHSAETPELSVVVASAHSLDELESCLAALVRQAQNRRIEIIVGNCIGDNSINDVITKFPEVVIIRLPVEMILPELWAAGIAQSTGKVIAITDSTCTFPDDWIASILTAHESSYAVIGGAVEIVDNKRWVDWAAYFCEYGQFMPPASEGVVKELPGNNISFKRYTLERGAEFVRDGFWKTYWCNQLRKEGVQLISEPSIVVYFRKSYRLLPFLIRRFHHGRCFAGMRTARATTLERTLYLVGSPSLPVLLLMRTLRAILPKRRYLKQFILSLPVSLLAILFWSIGEFFGYLAGEGKSRAKVY